MAKIREHNTEVIRHDGFFADLKRCKPGVCIPDDNIHSIWAHGRSERRPEEHNTEVIHHDGFVADLKKCKAGECLPDENVHSLRAHKRPKRRKADKSDVQVFRQQLLHNNNNNSNTKP